MNFDLMRFCDPTDYREYLRQPMSLKDGRIAASDGAVLFIPTERDESKPFPAAPETIEQAVNRLVQGAASLEHWTPVSALEFPEPCKCKSCNGSGFISYAECPDCDGDGNFIHGNHEYECKSCDGEGKLYEVAGTESDPESEKCWRCGGDGNGATFMKIPGLQSGMGADAKLLRKFPEDAAFSIVNQTGTFIALHGEGWVGFLMPMNDTGGR